MASSRYQIRIGVAVAVVLAIVAVVLVRCRHAERRAPATQSTATPGVKRPTPASDASVGAAVPGQTRAVVMPVDAAGGVLSGRVVNWSTGAGVANAELMFTATAGATTVRSGADGAFELAPATPGRYELSTVTAQGFMPYAPELAHSSVRVELRGNVAVRGVTIFLFPALDYFGHVVDMQGAPVAGARVTLIGTATGEQMLDKLETEWVADKQGAFTFHAVDDSVLEAVSGNRRGWARLDNAVQVTKQMTIKIGEAPARDATIRGRTVDTSGAPIADVLVRAIPEDGPRARAAIAKAPDVRATVFALSGDDGTFVIDHLDRKTYTLLATADEYAPAAQHKVAGGARDVTLTLDAGLPIAGVVVAGSDPVPAYTLLVERREGLTRDTVVERSVVDAKGRFAVRVPKGDYELRVFADGWAPNAPLAVHAGAEDVKITLTAGASVRGVVVDAQTGAPVRYARVTREGASGGASAQPANAGTVTREDGTFELAGIPVGPFSLSIAAGDYHPRLESGLVASEGGTLGPLRIALRKLAPGEEPKIELVGIGTVLATDGETLRVEKVVPDSGAADAGIVAGDRITAVDGVPVTTLGMDGAVTRIRGVAGTTVSITLERQSVPLVVTRKPLRV